MVSAALRGLLVCGIGGVDVEQSDPFGAAGLVYVDGVAVKDPAMVTVAAVGVLVGVGALGQRRGHTLPGPAR